MLLGTGYWEKWKGDMVEMILITAPPITNGSRHSSE